MTFIMRGACGKQFLLAGESDDLTCSCGGDDLRPLQLQAGIYELVPFEEDDESRFVGLLRVESA